MPEIFNKKFYLRTGYKITDLPSDKLSETLQDILAWSHDLNPGRNNKVAAKDVRRLEKYVQQYPDVKELKNHLQRVYLINDEKDKANAILEELLEKYPDYIFARLDEIRNLISEEKFEAAKEKLGTPRRIENFYKEEIIHVSGFRAYQYVAALMDIQEKDYEMAEKRANWLNFLEPELTVHKTIERRIMIARHSDFRDRMQEEQSLTKSVETFPKVTYEQTSSHTKLTHQTELESFFETNWDIIPDNYEQILLLPRETLIQDLEQLLLDSMRMNDFYYDNFEEYESNTHFPIHIARFLGYLKSTASLEIILNILRQGDEYLDFWYGDFAHNIFEPVIFQLAQTEKEWNILLDFVLEHNVYSDSKLIVTEVVRELILSEKMSREVGLNWFKTIFEYIFNHLDVESFIDTSFISFMAGDVAKARLVELMPYIKRGFDKNIILKFMCGTYEELEAESQENIETYHIKVQPSTLEEFYHPPEQPKNPKYEGMLDKLLKEKVDDDMFTYEELDEVEKALYEDDEEDDNWYFDDNDYEEEKPVRLASPRNQTFIRTEKKVGRNDPCPCGSGKKYKKCHGKK